jgi:hypothetical protein
MTSKLIAVVFDSSPIGYFYVVDEDQTFTSQESASKSVFVGVFEFTQLQTEIKEFIASQNEQHLESCTPIKHTYAGLKKLTPIAKYTKNLELLTGNDVLNINQSMFNSLQHYSIKKLIYVK